MLRSDFCCSMPLILVVQCSLTFAYSLGSRAMSLSRRHQKIEKINTLILPFTNLPGYFFHWRFVSLRGAREVVQGMAIDLITLLGVFRGCTFAYMGFVAQQTQPQLTRETKKDTSFNISALRFTFNKFQNWLICLFFWTILLYSQRMRLNLWAVLLIHKSTGVY